MVALNCGENRIVALQASRGVAPQTGAAASPFKPQNYCDNEPISVIFAALDCAHSALQSCPHKWKSYVIVGWDAKCEKAVQVTKSWAKRFRRHLSWRFGTNLTGAWPFKLQSYCDNEPISIIFTTLKCAYFVLQLELDRWKSNVIADWCARCEVNVPCWNVLRWSWRMPRLGTKIKYWLDLSALRNTKAGLVRILPGRSPALSDFTGHFFIGSVLSAKEHPNLIDKKFHGMRSLFLFLL